MIGLDVLRRSSACQAGSTREAGGGLVDAPDGAADVELAFLADEGWGNAMEYPDVCVCGLLAYDGCDRSCDAAEFENEIDGFGKGRPTLNVVVANQLKVLVLSEGGGLFIDRTVEKAIH